MRSAVQKSRNYNGSFCHCNFMFNSGTARAYARVIFMLVTAD